MVGIFHGYGSHNHMVMEEYFGQSTINGDLELEKYGLSLICWEKSIPWGI